MEIGKRIQHLRREKGLTQEQIAAALGVTSAAVSKWETNAALPDIGMLCPLARLLGITVDVLLDFRPALAMEEINGLLADRRKLFEGNKANEGVEACEALLREYPNDLHLKCAVAGLYVMYMNAGGGEEWARSQAEKAVCLLEQSRNSGDASLAANSRSMLVNLYVMREELDKALEILDELPVEGISTRIMRGNILLRKGALDEAEKSFQTELWSAGRNVTLGLIGLYNAAQLQKDWERAKQYLDTAMAVEKTLRTEELGGLSGTLQFLRAEVLRREGKLDDAVACLTAYVDSTLAQWVRAQGAERARSGFYGKLEISFSGMSAAYLARSIRAALEQTEDYDALKARADFQALLEKLNAVQ